MKRTAKALSAALSVFLAFCLLLPLSLSVAAADTVTQLEMVTSFKKGEYVFAMAGITPTGYATGSYALEAKNFTYEGKKIGLQFAAFDAEKDVNATKWVVERPTTRNITIQNKALGDKGYINIDTTGVWVGDYDETTSLLSVTGYDGNFSFFRKISGEYYYIRFTNGSSAGGPHFEAANNKSSYQFNLYAGVEIPKSEFKTSAAADAALPGTKPEMVVACISDLHCDYGLQSKAPYIRQSVIMTAEALKKMGNVDVLLVGGDMTSDNSNVRATGGWSKEIFDRVVNAYDTTLSTATKKGYTIYACGNHDHQSGEKEGYNGYAPYFELSKSRIGQPVSVHYEKDESANAKYPEFVLGQHFKIDRFDFININSPYASSLYYTPATLSWLDEELQKIGSENTVFVFGHYPMYDSRNISTSSYGLSGDHYKRFMAVLKKYSNVVYLYGHNHGAGNNVCIKQDTFERITTYSSNGHVIQNRQVIPNSFITAFMGSMSYYAYPFQAEYLGDETPLVIQTLLIYVYKDRLVFSMKNVGNTFSNGSLTIAKTPKTWTVMRDIAGTNLSDTPVKKNVSTVSEAASEASLAEGSEEESAVSGDESTSESTVSSAESQEAAESVAASAVSQGEKTESGSNAWVFILVGGIVLVLAGGGVFFLLRAKSRKEETQSEE